jgi:FkbM family methyltransferase
MTMVSRLLSLIPGTLLERMYYSKFSRILLPAFGYVTKNETLKKYTIFGDVLIEVDISKAGERAIPFHAFEPTVTQKFLQIIKKDSVVFDVGAWIGYYTLIAAKNAGKVIAIEPDETNCRRIKRNLDLNKFSNVTILNTAVGDKASQGVILEGESSLMHKVGFEGIGKTVRIESLDNIINNHLKIDKIDLLIMDIEGNEYFALKGLQNSLFAGIIKNLICEIHIQMMRENWGISESDVINLLTEYGYGAIILDKNVDPNHYHIYARPISQ